MDPAHEPTVDTDIIILPDALPKPDDKANVVSKVTSLESDVDESSLPIVDSASDPNPSTTSSNNLEQAIARVIEAVLTKPDQEEGDLAPPPSLLLAADADLQSLQDIEEQQFDSTDEDQDPSSEVAEEDEFETTLQGGLFSEDNGNQSTPDDVDEESHLETEEPDEPPENVNLLTTFAKSRLKTDDDSSVSGYLSQDPPLYASESAQKSSISGKDAALSTSSSPPPTLQSTTPAVRAELLHLLWLILLLCGGMAMVLILSLPRTRRYLLWPIRHWFYTKLPQQEQDTSLERVMLRELGEDLIID
ncbi:hypothetical protein DFQ26_003156 [Actinomortierella ambigua]|nr:hypothetical protein DFQ26_003156 [Actinomortierella ambigua]